MKRKAFRSKNWESKILSVKIEPCPPHEDSLGYRAIFIQGADGMQAQNNDSFAVGASYLDQRAQKLQNAGYSAPMTQRAISMVEAILQSRRSDIAAC